MGWRVASPPVLLVWLAHALFDFVDAGVGGGGAVGKKYGGDGLVAAVDLHDDDCGVFVLFNVDFGVRNFFAGEVFFEDSAVATPGGGKHCDRAGFGGVFADVHGGWVLSGCDVVVVDNCESSPVC